MHQLYYKILWAYEHRKEIGAGFMGALVAWTPIATFLARVIKRPPPAATWWKRGAYDLFIDTPSWTAALGHSGVFGGVFNLPGVPSRAPSANPTPAASKMMRQLGKEDSSSVGPPPPPWRGDNDSPLLALLVVAALAASGCATAQQRTMVAELALGKAVSLSYRTIDSIDQVETGKLHAEIEGHDVADARAEYDAYKPKIDQALAATNAGADLLLTADKLRDAAEKGQRDWSAYTDYLPQLLTAGARIESLVADLKAVLK